MISIYSDGSSSGRLGGAGGYGWVIVKNDQVLAWSYGGSPLTTNNLMEMEGAIQGLEAVLELGLNGSNEPLELVSDSRYCLGMASGEYTATKNFAETAKLHELAKKVGCRFRWVPGHQGNKYNEICDQLAKQGKIENRNKIENRKVSS
jgi:ribonuclease HI